MTSRMPEKFRVLDDSAWLQLLIKSISTRHIGTSIFPGLGKKIEFPGFPSRELQTEFIGSSDETALREASAFYTLVKKYASDLSKPLTRESSLLDFGCGWGRFLRFFWKDVEEENLHGCDTSQMIVDTCHALNVPGRIVRIDPYGILPYPDKHFDILMAYSVFTHLSRKVHLHWMRELARVCKPGAVFCLTLESRRFLDFIAGISADVNNNWYKLLRVHQPSLPEYYRAHDSGDFVFLPTNKGHEETYGDAVVPLSFIEQEWSPYFAVRDYIDDPKKFWQSVLVVQRL